MGYKEDLNGQRFGMLTVLYEGERGENGRIRWHCQCDCGNERDVSPYNLTHGITVSCGCTNRCGGKRWGRQRRDVTGRRFGMLTAIEPTEKRVCSQVVWLCKCDCGNFCNIPVGNLINGNTKSCGCLRHKKKPEACEVNQISSIKEARHAAGLSQAKMAEIFEIPKRTIEDWEAGTRKPPAYVEKLIIEKLDRMKRG